MPTIDPHTLVPGVVPDEHDLLVYRVESRTPGEEPWRVDLQKFCGNAGCDCPDFKFRKAKFLLKRALPAESLECWHIKQAKRYFTFECLNRIIDKRESESQANKDAARKSRMVQRVSEPARQADAASSGAQTATFKRGQPTPFAKPPAVKPEQPDNAYDGECPF